LTIWQEADTGAGQRSQMFTSLADKNFIAVAGEIIEATSLSEDLVYVDQNAAGFRRRRAGKSFAYYDLHNRLIRDASVLARIRALAIPPAYEDVWISPIAAGHIQATGRDARGRKQYRYHRLWNERSGAAKFDRMATFARGLPALREQLSKDLQSGSLTRRRVLAAVVHLLESTLIRVGDDEYARQNKSFGLTTLIDRHVLVEGAKLRFEFTGKSGKMWRLSLTGRRMARVVRECQELPGQRLFRYVDERGWRLAVTSADVNAYLREISGRDITAKDFRTWAGTWRAATALAKTGPCASVAEAKRNVRKVVAEVAERLGNTPTVCRKSYIHPEIVEAYFKGELRLRPVAVAAGPNELSAEERSVLAFLKRAGRPAKSASKPQARRVAAPSPGTSPSAAH
jgi:DNA topoisomerase-1